MSYLRLPIGVPDFSKAVLSLWFKVPKQSILNVAAAAPASYTQPFRWILPLVVFGQKQQRQDFEYLYGQVSSDPQHPLQAYYGWRTVGAPYHVDPCYIGLYCHADGTFDLAFNLQLNTYGYYSALNWVVQPPAQYVPGGIAGGYLGSFKITPKEATETVFYGPPEYFLVLSGDRFAGSGYASDTWHHLLVSFDLTGFLSIGNPVATSDCRLWYAIDDVDKRGPENLRPYRDVGDGLDPNAILTENIYNFSGPFEKTFYQTPVPAPVGTYRPSPIPSNGHEFGVPGVSAFVDNVRHVYMAELQMWLGETLDTGKEKNRRAFIGFPEGSLPPASEEIKTGMIPMKPEKAGALLGRRPDVLLHRSTKWIAGENTGSLGTTADGTEIRSGQFAPTGVIKKYTPNPELGK